MSTLAYAALTAQRDAAAPRTSTTTQSPGVGTYVDAFAALVPAEVLTAHAIILTFTTKTVNEVNKPVMVTVESTQALQLAFYGLIMVSVALYVLPRLKSKTWDNWDYLRMLIPPLAFVGWTMLQKATAFDAVAPSLGDATRAVIGIIGAIILGGATSALAYKADQHTA